MIDTSKVSLFLTQTATYAKETLAAGKVVLATVQNSPTVLAAQPAIALVGSVLGMISGYEIGHTAILKARGLWNPSLVRPVVLLVGVLALTIISPPPVAIAIGACTIGAALIGATKAFFEKKSAEKLSFDDFTELYGKKPEDIPYMTPRLFYELKNPTKKDVCGLIWHLTRRTCNHGESFTEGTFVLESSKDEAQAIYDKISTIEGSYSRHSSHFEGRSLENISHKGLELETLPANKRTILFGLADTHDGNKVLFIKPENWGADHRFESLKNNPEKRKHFANHTLQFFHAQYVKIMRPGYDNRPGTAKERIPSEWNTTTKFGFADLTPEQKQSLVEKGLISEKRKNDTYRTGGEVYIKF